MKKILYINFLVFLIVSCHQKEVIKNAENDLKSAEVLVKHFYKDLSNLDTIKINNYLNDNISKSEFSQLVKENNLKFGKLNEATINKVETIYEDIDGNIKTEYKIEITVYYDNVKNIETLGFIKENDNKAKLFSYYLKQLN